MDDLVQAGDKIELRFFEEPAISGSYMLDDEGQTVLPLLGTVDLSRERVRDLPNYLRKRYEEYLRNSALEVRVLRRVGIHGEVRAPGLYWLDATVSVREAVALAGGLTEAGDSKRVTLFRNGQPVAVEAIEGYVVATTSLRSGDQIVVARRSWLSLNVPLLITAGVSAMSVLAGFFIAR